MAEPDWNLIVSFLIKEPATVTPDVELENLLLHCQQHCWNSQMAHFGRCDNIDATNFCHHDLIVQSHQQTPLKCKQSTITVNEWSCSIKAHHTGDSVGRAIIISCGSRV